MKRKLSVILSVVLSLGILASCGKSDSSASDTSKIDAAEASGHVATEVNIGFVDTSGGGVLTGTLGVARDYGFLDEEFETIGVKVNLVPMTGAGPAINEALASGDLDIAEYGDVPLVNGKANGVDTQLIAFGGMNTKGSLISAPGTDYKSVTDLKGKIIATQKGSYMHRELINILKDAGLTIDDVDFVNATAQDAASMIEAGSVDAVIESGAILTRLANQGYNIVVDYRENPQYWCDSGAAARTEFINDNPDIIKAYVRALIKAAKYTADDPNIQVAQFETSGESEEAFNYLYPDFDYYSSVAPVDGEIDNLKDVLSFLLDNDLITADKEFDIDEWINSSFYEEAFNELGDEYRVIYTDR